MRPTNDGKYRINGEPNTSDGITALLCTHPTCLSSSFCSVAISRAMMVRAHLSMPECA